MIPAFIIWFDDTGWKHLNSFLALGNEGWEDEL